MINFSSPAQLSLLFFGGIIKEECQVPILNELGVQEVYKTGAKRGQQKTKKGTKDINIKGLKLKPKREWETKKEGIFQTNEKILKEIASSGNAEASRIASLILKLRELEKMLGTYYTGFEDKIYPDGCIRGNISHVSTETGRTSSNRPNLQNLAN